MALSVMFDVIELLLLSYCRYSVSALLTYCIGISKFDIANSNSQYYASPKGKSAGIDEFPTN